MENPKILEIKLDKIYISNVKLHVNLPRFRRREGMQLSQEQPEGGDKGRGSKGLCRTLVNIKGTGSPLMGTKVGSVRGYHMHGQSSTLMERVLMAGRRTSTQLMG